jgi:hypothetical protein
MNDAWWDAGKVLTKYDGLEGEALWSAVLADFRALRSACEDVI